MAAQNQPNRAEQTARSATSRTVGKAIASRIVNSAAGKAVGSALGAIGGTVVPVVGNIVGGLIGGAVAGAVTKGVKEAGKALGALPFALANLGAQLASVIALSLTQTLGAAFTFSVAALAILAAFVAFAMFIITSGAYIVPPSAGSLGGGGGSGASATTLCFNFVNFPENVLATEQQAANIIGQAENYVRTLCSRGPITVRYIDAPSGPNGWCGVAGNGITIYQCGAGNLGNTLYTLAHESGHIHAGLSNAFQAYLQSGAWQNEGQVCTYPYDNSVYESYPEMIAVYIGGPNPPPGFAVGSSGVSRLGCFGGNFRTGMPDTWQFARDSIFLEDLEW